MLESRLKQKIYKVLDKDFPGHHRRKLSGQFIPGCLDLIITYNAKVVWLELKVYPRALTPLQAAEIVKIKEAGGCAYSLTYYPKDNCYLLSNNYWEKRYDNLLTLLKGAL